MLLAMSTPALAADPTRLPEPGTLALVGLAVAAGLVVARKKK
jgi:hypothetical protein